MIKLNKLKDTETIIGQLYVGVTPLNEVVAVQYNSVVGLNSTRHWSKVWEAGDEFFIRPISIQLLGVIKQEVNDFVVDSSTKLIN
jgi:hypothetical protein